MKSENIFRGEVRAALLTAVPLGLHDVQVERVGVPGRKNQWRHRFEIFKSLS